MEFEILKASEAISRQKEWSRQLVLEDRLGAVNFIAGVDVGFEKVADEDDATLTRAAVVILSYPALECIEQVVERIPTRMPYIPGLLSFRELPAVIKAFEKIKTQPDLVMVDGHGIAHPRRFGIASHLGLYLGKPSIGIAKKRLYGEYALPGNEVGDSMPIFKGNEQLGSVLRTRLNVKPVFVSPGHLISIDTSVTWVCNCLTGYKLPEPTRLADRLASRRTRALQNESAIT